MQRVRGEQRASATISVVIRRRMAVGLVLLLAGWSLVACGAGSHSPSKAATSTAGDGSKKSAVPPPSTSLSKAQAIALARSINLRASDVPGFTASAKEEKTNETASEKRLEQEMLKCVGASGLGSGLGKSLAEGRSDDFKLERGILNLSVHSEVSVAQSAALAGKDLGALRGSRVKACLSHYLNLFFKASLHSGTSIGPVSIQSGTPPAPGTAGSFGWRISSTFTVRRIPVPFYFDILSFAYGPAEVTLFSSGLPAPFPAKAQENLFSLLVARAEKRVLPPS
jgi:hypothetical protein